MPDIDKAFGFTHQSVMTIEDWVVKTTVEYNIKIFEC